MSGTVAGPAQVPLYIYSPALRAMQVPRDKTIRVKGPDGNVIDELSVAGGEWVVREGSKAYTIPDEAFRSRHLPIPGDGRDWVARASAVRATVAGSEASIDGVDAPVEAKAFFACAVRCDEAGNPLCSAAWPLHLQAKALKSADTDVQAHLDALVVLRREAADGFVTDPAVQCDLHMFDLLMAGIEDSVSDGMASLHAVLPNQSRAVLSAMAGAIGLDGRAWTEVRHLPLYETSEVRAMARTLLSPHIGDFPMEDVQVLAVPHQEDDRIVSRALSWLGGGEELPKAPAMSHGALPGYSTSEMRRFKRGGMDYLVFEDLVATYVYAWPSPPSPAASQAGFRP